MTGKRWEISDIVALIEAKEAEKSKVLGLSPKQISCATIPIVERSETEFEMVCRHIRVGESVLVRQRKIIKELSDKGLPTDMAYELLERFEEIQFEHCAHLSRLQISN